MCVCVYLIPLVPAIFSAPKLDLSHADNHRIIQDELKTVGRSNVVQGLLTTLQKPWRVDLISEN